MQMLTSPETPLSDTPKGMFYQLLSWASLGPGKLTHRINPHTRETVSPRRGYFWGVKGSDINDETRTASIGGDGPV